MRICGVDVKANDAIVAVIDVDDRTGDWNVVEIKQAKIHLKNEFDTTEVRRVGRQIAAFLAEHHVARVAIKKQTKGMYPSGPPAHRLATLFQLGTEVDVEFIAGLSMDKKTEDVELPESLRKYQHDAARAALAVSVYK